MTDHLQGPWFAVLADLDGFVYESIDEAREQLQDPDSTFSVSIVRGTATPTGEDENLRLPGSYRSGDQIFDLDDLYLDGDDDESTGAVARYVQAQAMAAGLNAASGSVAR